jgi:hypothetical protein
MSWTPIVDRARVGSVLTDIVAAVDAFPRVHHNDLADYVVLRSYLESDGAVPDPEGASGDALATAVETLAVDGGPPGLYGGAARIGWTVAHHSEGDDANTVCDAIDAAILNRLTDWSGDYDLISGHVGIIAYALERGDAGVPIVRAALAGLEAEQAQAWLTPPRLLPPHQLRDAPDGYVNLGLAHGLPGVIAVTAQLVKRDLDAARARAVYDSALRRLLDGSPAGGPARFTAWQTPADPHDRPSPRLAWCYGDLGAATALLHAGLAIGDAEARDAGLELARQCASRSVEDARIADCGICHGAAGIAHLFNRMAQATGDAELRAAAERWIDQTLAMRTDLPIAGFPANEPETGGAVKLVANPSLLTGAVGVALVLHAASSEVEPSWDRLLLSDLPPV